MTSNAYSPGLGAVLLAAMLIVLPQTASAQFSFDFSSPTPEKSKTPAAEESEAPIGLPEAFGDDVALVELIEDAPGSGLSLMDTLQPDRVIELGSAGRLVLSYFSSCVRETITGGQVTVGKERSAVRGGRRAAEIVDCQGATPVITAELSEAGAAVKRVTPFNPEDWKEWTVKSSRPIFKWRPEGARGTTGGTTGSTARVTLAFLDSPYIKIIWQSETADSFFIYPPEAPPLLTGMPYLVQVDLAGAEPMAAVFSIDPWLDVADNAANSIVPVAR